MLNALPLKRMWKNVFQYFHCSISLFTLISLAYCSSPTPFPKSCHKSNDETEVSLTSGIPRTMIDFYLITDSGETNGVKMMRKFTNGVVKKVKALRDDYGNWNAMWIAIEGGRRGLEHVCEEYDSAYNELFPYCCYTKAKWCLMKELFDQLLEQMGTIWKPSGSSLELTQPWLGFFNPPNDNWRNSFINEMKMACETFFHHPLLGSMTKKVKQNGEDLKSRIINRIYYFIEQNQHENLKIFIKRFEWIKQPFENTAVSKAGAFVNDMNQLLCTGNSMISDTDTFNWDFALPVPRTRELIAMLWLVIPKSVRDLFPSPTSNEIVLERVKRFLQIAFDNVLDKNSNTLEALVRHNINLTSQVKDDCEEASYMEFSGLECEISMILEDTEKLVELVKESNWESGTTMDERSVSLISFLATKSKQFFEVTMPKLREIVSDAFERFYVYSKETDASGLERYIKFKPPFKLINIGTERSCSEYFADLK